MLNMVVNVIYGFIFQSMYVGYVYNRIKNINYKSTYIIYLISYILGSIITSFNYSFIFYSMIIMSIIFYIIYSIIHKEWKQITNFFLILNILTLTSIVTAIPLIFLKYNIISLIFNFMELLVIMLFVKKYNFNKLYKKLMQNWNRTSSNKIKSVTIRNFILIVLCISITLINLFINNYFINIYNSIL